jgi:hypothetical protein
MMLEGMQPPSKTKLCRVLQLRDEMEDADKVILETALKDYRWSAGSLSQALRSRGFTIAAETLRGHMNGSCLCSKI